MVSIRYNTVSAKAYGKAQWLYTPLMVYINNTFSSDQWSPDYVFFKFHVSLTHDFSSFIILNKLIY